VKVSSSPADILEFMRYSPKGYVRAFWDLDESLSSLFRILPSWTVAELAGDEVNVEFGKYTLRHYPDSQFIVGGVKQHTSFFSLNHFWSATEPTPTTLEDAQAKADELAEELEKFGLGDFSTLVSPIGLFQRSAWGKAAYETLPTIYDHANRDEAVEYASECDKREWISAHVLGGFKSGELYDWDLSGAYPSVAAGLLDLNDMTMWKSDRMGKREESAYYGWLRGRLILDPNCEYAHASPFMLDSNNPLGDFGDDYYMTLAELRHMERFGFGEFQFKDGWFASVSGGVRPGQPLRKMMNDLYSHRSDSPLSSSIGKNISNQIIGKFIARNEKTGTLSPIRNDLWHSVILAENRIRVSRFIIENEIKADELVCVQTDGIRTTKPIPQGKNGFGQWRCNGAEPTLVASPHKVFCQEKKPNSMTYEMVTGLINEHPQSQFYGCAVQRRVTLAQAAQREDIAQVGSIDLMPAHLDMTMLEGEQRRVFGKFPKTGGALLNGKYYSEAIVL
jgi:hypothetical protein